MREPVEKLIEQYQKHIFAAAFSVCQNIADADDIVQDTFLKYHCSKKEFSSEEHIKAWLLRVAINKAKDRARCFWNRNTISIDELIMASPENERLTLAEQDESKQILENVMKLPTKYRIVIHLFYYDDLSVAEIAKVLGLSESNVKTRLSRARNMLKNDILEVEAYV